MYINIYLCNNALYLYSFSKLIITYQSWYDHHFSLLWLYTFSNLNVTYNRKYMSYKHMGKKHHLFIFSLIHIWKNSKAKPTLISSWIAALHCRILSVETVSTKLCSMSFIILPNILRKCSLAERPRRNPCIKSPR